MSTSFTISAQKGFHTLKLMYGHKSLQDKVYFTFRLVRILCLLQPSSIANEIVINYMLTAQLKQIFYLSDVKRFALLLISTIYLFSSFGFTVNSFYCCGVLTSTSISLSKPLVHTCDMSYKKVPGCCENKTQSVQVKDQHVASDFLTLSPQDIVAVLVPSFSFVERKVQTASLAFNSHAPPYRKNTPVYILNCTYRI